MRLIILHLLVIAPLCASERIEITQRGEASQSHSHGSNLYPAQNAIDGDLTTFNHTASTAPGAAWFLEFPEEEEISRIEVIPRDCCSGRLTGSTLRLFDVADAQVYEADVIDGGPLSTFGVDFPEGIMAKRLRIGFEPTQTGIVHMAEVRAFSEVGDPPVIHSFTTNSGTLSWSVTGADSVMIHDLGNVASSGTLDVSPAESTRYLLIAENACDTVHATAAVEIGGLPISPRITEIKATPEDWVEIWNPGNGVLDLTGWALTDDPTRPDKWIFHAGQVLESGAFLVIEEPFGLAREAGSYVALIDATGTEVSRLTYPRQFPGGSYGLDLDGKPHYFLEPSPGDLNLSETTEGFLEGVTFSQKRGFYSERMQVELTPISSEASILYSLDGSDPTLPYSSPFLFNKTAVLRAKEIQQGFVDSPVEAHSYLYLQDVVNQPEFPAGFPTNWQPEGTNGALAPIPRPSDYEFDPRIQGDLITMLQQVPTISLTIPRDDMWGLANGLHPNAEKRGREWEKAISMEIIDPATGLNTYYNCGLRVHGGRGRVSEMLRKSFRLYFRSDYGSAKFKEPIFPNFPPDGIDHLVLRSGTGRTWASPWRDRTGSGNSLPRVTYLRDQFYRDCQRLMENPSLSGNFSHLYINGLYWGLYNPVERPGENYAANHFGGNEEDYDVLKWANGLPTQVTNGEIDGWEELRALTGGAPANDWDVIQERLDVRNLIDYMMVNFYVGNQDWVRNNVYAFRRREGGNDNRFKFLCWDGEETFISLSRNSTTDGRDKTTTPLELHDDLRIGSAEYRLMFADQIHKHLVDEDGVLTAPIATARHQALADSIDQAIIGESARWGDLFIDDTIDPGLRYTREDHWLPEITNINNTFLAQRPTITLGHLRADGLYPSTIAPLAAIEESSLTITSSSGTIYFTLDGSDPRLEGGAINSTAKIYAPENLGEALVSPEAVWSYFDQDQDLSGSDWQTPSYNDSAWQSGPAPLGYGSVTGFDIATVISSGTNILNRPITAYFRHHFTVDDPTSVNLLLLTYIRDDGLVVYLNGQEIDRSNLPAGPITGSTLTLENGSETDVFQTTVAPEILVAGENVIAVEVHQRSSGSSDLGFELSLVSSTVGLPISGDVHLRARTLNDSEWSPLEDEMRRLMVPSSTLNITEIMYHPPDPTLAEEAAGFMDDDDFEFIELKNVTSGDLLLEGFRFSKGINLDLSGTLAAGEIAVVVKNRAAFELRYGTSTRILGEWGDYKLNNGGELLRLRNHENEVVFEVNYDDQSPWTDLSDGNGQSLVLRNPASFPNLNLPQNWRPSAKPGGNPGNLDAEGFFGTDLLSYAIPIIHPVNQLGAISAELNILADDMTVSLELSDDLSSWETVEFTNFQDLPNSRRIVRFENSGGSPKRFYRFRVKR